MVGPRQIEFKVHGLTAEEHGRVPARLFAAKLTQLVAALEAADAMANGIAANEYILADMHMSEPTALLKEVPKFAGDVRSSIPVFNDAVEAIKVHDPRIEQMTDLVRKISALTSGATKKYGFAEVKTVDNLARIDDFLHERAKRAKKKAGGMWYNGAAIGSFDGVLNYVDTRGSLPQIKLTLAAGGKEIDGVCSREDIDALGVALDSRVRIFGRAIYSSSSPLPIRVEVSSIVPIKKDADLTKWRGSFLPFTIESWEGDA